MTINIRDDDAAVVERKAEVHAPGWTNIAVENLELTNNGGYIIEAELWDEYGELLLAAKSPITASVRSIVPKILFSDLHVHSDDTVGTENSLYNFSYGKDIAGLDVLGYTANDFQITKERWDATLVVSLLK